MVKSDSPKVNHFGWGVTEHEVRQQICQIDAPSRLHIHYLWEKRLCLSTRMMLKAVHFFSSLHMAPLTKTRKHPVLSLFSWFLLLSLSLSLQLLTWQSGGNEENTRYLNQLVVINETGIEMTWKQITKALGRFDPSLLLFFLLVLFSLCRNCIGADLVWV